MSKHTPGPLRIKKAPPSRDGREVETVALHGGERPVVAVCLARADAEYYVACVNACEGINPEAVPELLSALRSLCRAKHPLEWSPSVELVTAFASARAAIAKAEGRS